MEPRWDIVSATWLRGHRRNRASLAHGACCHQALSLSVCPSMRVLAGAVAVNVQRRVGEPRTEGADDLLHLLIELLGLALWLGPPRLDGRDLGRELRQVDGEELAILHD